MHHIKYFNKKMDHLNKTMVKLNIYCWAGQYIFNPSTKVQRLVPRLHDETFSKSK